MAKSTFKEEYCNDLQLHLLGDGSLRSFAKEINKNYLTICNWIKKYPSFAKVYKNRPAKINTHAANRIIHNKKISDEKKIEKIKAPRFWESKEWIRLEQRLSHICHSMGKGQIAEDVVSAYKEKLLRGQNLSQTLDHFFIDYCRAHKIHDTRRPVYNCEFDETYHTEDSHSKNPADIDEIEVYVQGLDPIDRVVTLLHFKYEMDNISISKLFGWTPANVSHKLKRVSKEIKDRLNKERAPKVSCLSKECFHWYDGNCIRSEVKLDKEGVCSNHQFKEGL
jgi:DNA-directed RNA polymerase specialized sigma24 family protein